MLAAEKGAVEIDCQHAAPGGVVGILDAGEERDPGGIDQTVEAPVRAPDLAPARVPVAFRGDIETMIDAGPACEIGRDRHAALAFHRRGNGLADGAAGAGDQHDLVVETSHAAPR